jgi:hypothetical protein
VLADCGPDRDEQSLILVCEGRFHAEHYDPTAVL